MYCGCDIYRQRQKYIVYIAGIDEWFGQIDNCDDIVDRIILWDNDPMPEFGDLICGIGSPAAPGQSIYCIGYIWDHPGQDICEFCQPAADIIAVGLYCGG